MNVSVHSEITPLSRQFPWPGDDGLRIAALNLLQSSGFSVMRRLRCEVTAGVVIVYGVLPSYYLKQMAQAVILGLEGIRSVTNLVEVRRGPERQAT